MTTDAHGRAHHPPGTSAGGRFTTTARTEPQVQLDDIASRCAPDELVDPGPPPTGDTWARAESPYTGLVTYAREFDATDGRARHAVSGLAPDGELRHDGQAMVLGSGSVTIAQGDRIPGEMIYKVLDAPLADGTGRRVKAIYINWVEVQRNRGKGWASAMYEAVRQAHPDCVIPAAAVLEAPGRRVVKHYRGKYPQVHTGRFDTDCVVHPTDGPDDKTYRAAMLEP